MIIISLGYKLLTRIHKKHLPFIKVRIRILVSDQVAETCDACDRTEDLGALRFSIYVDFSGQVRNDRKSIETNKTIFKL